MSLINDALKRAKQAQDQAGPPDPPPLQIRPAEPAPTPKRGPGPVLYVVIALAVVAVLAGGWWFVQNNRSEKPGVGETAKSSAEASTMQDQPAPASPAPPPVKPAPVAVAPEPMAAPMTNRATAIPSQTIASVKPAAQSAVAAAMTPSAPAPAAAAPAPPPPPRLQAIVFHPTRPSAMISGKSVRVGDKVGELRVTAIDRDSVTLSGGGHTNVLNLPE
jgi:hypothetical protein